MEDLEWCDERRGERNEGVKRRLGVFHVVGSRQVDKVTLCEERTACCLRCLPNLYDFQPSFTADQTSIPDPKTSPTRMLFPL